MSRFAEGSQRMEVVPDPAYYPPLGFDHVCDLFTPEQLVKLSEELKLDLREETSWEILASMAQWL